MDPKWDKLNLSLPNLQLHQKHAIYTDIINMKLDV